jgi:hypothetical protein
MGHYANKCPQRKLNNKSNNNNTNNTSEQKTVRFEAAHITTEEEEHCQMAREVSNKDIALAQLFDLIENDSWSKRHERPQSPILCQSIDDDEHRNDESNQNKVLERQPRYCYSHNLNEIDDITNIFEEDSIDSINFDMANQDIILGNEYGIAHSNPNIKGDDSFDSADVCAEETNIDKGTKGPMLFQSPHSIEELEPINGSCQEFAFMSGRRRRRGPTRNQISASSQAFAHGDFAMWLLDSGATSHFTPDLNDLMDAERLQNPIYIRVADGSHLVATHVGTVELNFMSDQHIPTILRLLRVLYVPNLQTQLFSIESFVRNGRYSVLYSAQEARLQFRDNMSMTIHLPHVPPGTYVATNLYDIGAENPRIGFDTNIHRDAPRVQGNFLELQPDGEVDAQFIGMAQEVKSKQEDNVEHELVDDPQAQGGGKASP